MQFLKRNIIRQGIVPIYTSEVDAITLLLRDSVRWVLATRPLSGDELESFHSNKFFPESIKIATDGVALIVNRQNADSIFNVSTLKKIFSGEITRWNQLSADSKLGEIQVVFDHREFQHGTLRAGFNMRAG